MDTDIHILNKTLMDSGFVFQTNQPKGQSNAYVLHGYILSVKSHSH